MLIITVIVLGCLLKKPQCIPRHNRYEQENERLLNRHQVNDPPQDNQGRREEEEVEHNDAPLLQEQPHDGNPQHNQQNVNLEVVEDEEHNDELAGELQEQPRGDN